jgi:hypothetical protein
VLCCSRSFSRVIITHTHYYAAFDRLRDVVWDQPYRQTDTVVYWQTPNAGEFIVPEMLSDCFKLTLATNTGENYERENVSY